ncbi:MAG: GNAT family N-acetyltransferase [Verrucomicrobiae bacterium]
MFNLEPLGEQHDREGFDCRVEALNRYLSQVARQHEAKSVARTYVLTDDGRTIAGFFALTFCQIDGGTLPKALAKKLPKQIPAMRLGRLAVSKSRQKQGIGQMLISSVLVMVERAEKIAGGVGLFVDAKDDEAAAYYAQFGFRPLEGAHLTLFLPIQTIRQHNAAAL